MRSKRYFWQKNYNALILIEHVVNGLHHDRCLSTPCHTEEKCRLRLATVSKLPERLECRALLVVELYRAFFCVRIFFKLYERQTPVHLLGYLLKYTLVAKRFKLSVSNRAVFGKLFFGYLHSFLVKQVGDYRNMCGRAQTEHGIRAVLDLFCRICVDSELIGTLVSHSALAYLVILLDKSRLDQLFYSRLCGRTEMRFEIFKVDLFLFSYVVKNKQCHRVKRASVRLGIGALVYLVRLCERRGGKHTSDGVSDRAERLLLHKEAQTEHLLRQRKSFVAYRYYRLVILKLFARRSFKGDHQSDLPCVCRSEGHGHEITYAHFVAKVGR